MFGKLLRQTNQYRRKKKFDRIVRAANSSKIYNGAVIINRHQNPDLIHIGAHTHVKGELQLLAQGGCIKIGDYCYIGEQTRIWSCEKIVIGNRVLIAHNVNIHDNISHPINSSDRHRDYKRILGLNKESPQLFNLHPDGVEIKDDAWIGFNASILKGVTVGKGAIIGAGSVVTEDVPDLAVVVGNPAKIIKYTS